jgi:hypothetical protein
MKRRSIIFWEIPKRFQSDLGILIPALGQRRPASPARELLLAVLNLNITGVVLSRSNYGVAPH